MAARFPASWDGRRGELRLRPTLRLRLRPSWKICCDIHSP